MKLKLASGVQYYIVQFGSVIVAFFSLPILTRMYSAEVYGQYLLIISAVTLLNTTSIQWLANSIHRFWPGNQNIATFSRQLNTLTILLAVVVGSLSLLLLPFIPSVPFSLRVATLVTVFTMLSSMAIIRSAELITLQKASSFAFLTFAQNAIPPILAIGLAQTYQPNLIALLLSQIVGNAVAVTVGYVEGGIQFAQIERKWIVELLRFGAPLAIWSLASRLLSDLDRFMIAYFLDPASAGIYAVNYNVVVSLQSFLFAPLLLAADPVFMRLKNLRDPHYAVVLRQTISLFSLLAALSFGIFLSSYSLIGTVLMGQEFRSDNQLMVWISLGHIFWGFGIYANKAFEFRKETWKISLLGILSVVVNFCLNMLFIPSFGISAAAVTTLCSYFFYAILVYVVGSNYENLTPHFYSLPFIIAIPVAMFLLSQLMLSLLPESIFLNLIIVNSSGGVLFLGAVWVMNQREAIFPIWQR